MLVSMTGFGRAILDAPFGRLIAEIQAVNRKYLEISISLPKEFSRFEQDVRGWICEKIARGQVTARLYLIPNSHAAVATLPDAASLKELKKEWEKIAKILGYPIETIDLSFLVLHSPIQQKIYFAEDRDLIDIEKCLKEALRGLLRMRQKEGTVLVKDVKSRLAEMKTKLQSIEQLAPNARERMYENLLAKLKDLQPGSELDERMARELLLFADKVDITEEITRLQSHFLQFHSILGVKKEPVGRKMDFLIQEIGREINTIGSKSLDAKISHLVVNMKSELEKIREQIQNIE